MSTALAVLAASDPSKGKLNMAASRKGVSIFPREEDEMRKQLLSVTLVNVNEMNEEWIRRKSWEHSRHYRLQFRENTKGYCLLCYGRHDENGLWKGSEENW